jgi:hypothetical protein
VPRIGPLSPEQARRTLANRLSRVGDRVRQLETRLGLRPYRCFLVWTQWTGGEPGHGDPAERIAMELLPTPKVRSLDSVTFSVFHAGTIPAGSIKLSEVSARYTYDQLKGLMVPGHEHQDRIPNDWEFFYEVREDGRGDDPARRFKFRLLSEPNRHPENLEWTLMLEKISEDRGRNGESKYLSGEEG